MAGEPGESIEKGPEKEEGKRRPEPENNEEPAKGSGESKATDDQPEKEPEKSETELLQERVADLEKQLGDIEAREEFVKNYNAALNKRESKIADLEIKRGERERGIKDAIKCVDEKQGIVASKIAAQEDGLEKFQRASDDLETKRQSIDGEERLLESRIKAFEEKVSALDGLEKTLSHRGAAIKVMEDRLKEGEAKLIASNSELEAKEKELSDTSHKLSLERRESDALRKQVQRLITLNKIEDQVKDV